MSRGDVHCFPPIEAELLRIMIKGGMHAVLRAWKADQENHPRGARALEKNASSSLALTDFA